MAVPSEFLFWGGLLAVGTAYELRALSTGDNEKTLSDVTRDVFFTHTKSGRVVFTLAWGAFAVWYGRHVLSGSDE